MSDKMPPGSPATAAPSMARAIKDGRSTAAGRSAAMPPRNCHARPAAAAITPPRTLQITAWQTTIHMGTFRSVAGHGMIPVYVVPARKARHARPAPDRVSTSRQEPGAHPHGLLAFFQKSLLHLALHNRPPPR